MRAAVAIAVVVTTIVIGSAPVAAKVTVWESGVGEVGVSDHRGGSPGGPGSGGTGPSGGGGGGGGTVRTYAYWTVGWNVDRFCRQLLYTTDPEVAAAYDFAYKRRFAGGNADGSADICPAGTDPLAPLALPTPDQIARDFWTVRILPAPTLHMSPDYAVTGKTVYLEIDGEQHKRFDIPNPIGPAIAIETTSRYVVDWGDGTVTTTASQGGPWPDGDVTHVYTTSSPARTIRVTQQWSATWRAGDQQGDLDTLRTDGTLTFRVTQVQAVRG